MTHRTKYEIPVRVDGRRLVLVPVYATNQIEAVLAVSLECIRLGYEQFEVWDMSNANLH